MNKTVLVVDDDFDCLRVVSDYLSYYGHTAVVANSARAALRLVTRGQLDPDLIIADLAMPGMDGVTFIEELRKYRRAQDVPIVIISAFGEAEAPTPRGTCARFQKPIDLDALRACIASV